MEGRLQSLYRVRQLPDVFVDACVRNEAGEVLFMSCYARDGVLQQFFSMFSLKPSEGGLSSFHLVELCSDLVTGETTEGRAHLVHVGNAEQLTKHSGRLPRVALFGSLVQTWIYQPALLAPDRVNGTAWLLHNQAYRADIREHIDAGVWALYKQLARVPLLDAWQKKVMRATRERCVLVMDDTAYPPLGEITAVKVWLEEDFSRTVSQMVKAGSLGIAEPLANAA